MDDGAGEFTRLARAEVYEMQHRFLGPTEMIGDVAVAVVAPIALWNHLPHVHLVLWGALVALIAIGWEIADWRDPDLRVEPDGVFTALGWMATLVWAALPWIAPSALADQGVVWILVFVAVVAIGADTVFVSQTSGMSIDEMVVVYSLSYVTAFGLAGAWPAIVAVVVAFISFVVGGFGFARITDQLVAKREQSEMMVRQDALTGLGTRAAAIDAITRLRDAGVGEVHCAFMDLDDFKQLNDNYGHQAGDLALRATGEILMEHFPPSWVVSRFGGDEFVAVGDSAIDLEPMMNLRLVIASHGGLVLSQLLSAGVTVCPAADASPDALFSEASAALRQAKRLGKGQVVTMTDDLRTAELRKVRLGARTASALAVGEIVPWAQPIVDLRTGLPVGMELLARWLQDDGSIVPPAQFVPILEDQGRGPALGLLMIGHAVNALSSAQLQQTSSFVTVNLSARHLFDRRLPSQVRDLLHAEGVAAERLVVEITESQEMYPSPEWRDTAHALRRLGVGLAIDDFGTGYSSLEQLMSMPFNYLKVDQFITRSVSRPGAAELASAIAAIANGGEMTVVAEGVETAEQRVAMLDAGYRLGQGFLFAHPVPVADAIEVLAADGPAAPGPSASEPAAPSPLTAAANSS